MDSTTLSPSSASKPRRPRRTAWKAIAWSLAFAAIVQPVACWAGAIDGWADLLSHFQEPAFVVTAVAALMMVRVRRWVAVGLLVLAVAQGVNLFKYDGSNPVEADPRMPDRLRILVVNVLTDNVKREPLIALIRQERPDIVGLIEVSPEWLADLAPVSSEFAFRLEFPSYQASGLALWSHIPLTSFERPATLTDQANPALRTSFDFASQPRTFWLIHNVSPFEKPAGIPLDAEFSALATRIRQEGGSTIVVGDMNSTDASPHFRRFLQASGLRDGRLGLGRQRSWPEWSYYRIAIDHTFISPDLAVTGRRLGPPVGSDHLPVVLDLAPAASSSAKVAAQLDHSPVDSGSTPANLATSAAPSMASSREARSGPIRSANARSAVISSVVREPHDGP